MNPSAPPDSPRRIATLAVAAALAAVALAGCGSADRQKFVNAYENATAPLHGLDLKLGADLARASDTSDAQLQAALTGLAAQTRAIDEQLKTLDPPSSAKPAVDDLRRALESRSANLSAVAGAVKTGDIKATRSAVSKLTAGGGEIARARAAVEKKVGN